MKTLLIIIVTTVSAMAGSTYLLFLGPFDTMNEIIEAHQVEKAHLAGTIVGLESELFHLRRQLDMDTTSLPSQSDYPQGAKLRPAVVRKHKDFAEAGLPTFVALETTKNPSLPAQASLDDYFYSESGDPAWANRTENQLIHAFDRLNLENSFLLNAECRSTFCRIEVYHEDNAAEQSFIKAFAQNDRFDKDDKFSFYRSFEDSDGNLRTLFFYARKGHYLPGKESQ